MEVYASLVNWIQIVVFQFTKLSFKFIFDFPSLTYKYKIIFTRVLQLLKGCNFHSIGFESCLEKKK